MLSGGRHRRRPGLTAASAPASATGPARPAPRGLPPDRVASTPATSPASPPGTRSASRSRLVAWSSSKTPALVTPGSRSTARSPVRAAKSITIRSACRRRAANASASSDGRSSHCTSSTQHSTGRSAAASRSRPSTAAESANISSWPQAPLSSTRVRMAACGSGQAGHPVRDRAEQPVQAGEGQIRLPFAAAGGQHEKRLRGVRGRVQQRCFADAHVPVQRQRRATPVLGVGQRDGDRLLQVAAPPQAGVGHDRWAEHSASVTYG